MGNTDSTGGWAGHPKIAKRPPPGIAEIVKEITDAQTLVLGKTDDSMIVIQIPGGDMVIPAAVARNIADKLHELADECDEDTAV